MANKRLVKIFKLGLIDFQDAHRLQKKFNNKISDYDTLLVLEHTPVYTIGRGKKNFEHLLKTSSLYNQVIPCERGGLITYHCPGQVVLYPLLNLNFYEKNVRWYVNSLENLVIRTLKRFGVNSFVRENFHGVWVGNKKLSAVGTSISRWKTMHGLSLNVNCNLDGFRKIVPCGIGKNVDEAHLDVGNLQDFVPNEIDIEDVKNALINEFKTMFQVEVVFEDILSEK